MRALYPVTTLAAWCQVSVAHADTMQTVSAGYLHSFRAGGGPGYGNGVEATYVYYTKNRPFNGGAIGVGAFLHVESVGDDGVFSLSVGSQLNVYAIGIELGYDYLAANRAAAATHGAYLGAFASVGVLSLGPHVVLPLAHGSEGRARDEHFAFTLALKVPWIISGEPFSFSSGRPLRVGGAIATAEPSAPAESTPSALWLERALMEHASVAAFARLVLELASLGAPAELLGAATDAQRDEVEHARYCFARAGELAGYVIEPAEFPLALAPLVSRTLAELAVDSLRDGCLGEGYAAAVLELAGMSQMAADERRHAALGLQIVRWCVARGGAPVAAALEAALETLPEWPELAPDLAPAFDQICAFERTRRAVLAELEPLLEPLLATELTAA